MKWSERKKLLEGLSEINSLAEEGHKSIHRAELLYDFYKIKPGDIIEHTKGPGKRAIGIVIGILNNLLNVNYLNNEHCGYAVDNELGNNYKIISKKEMIEKLKIKQMKCNYKFYDKK